MLVHILLSIPVIFAFLVILIRIVGVREIPLGPRKIRLSVEPAFSGETVTASDILDVVGWALFIRFFFYLLSVYILPLFDVGEVSNLPTMWGNWDGSHYINLAKLGYENFTEDGEHLFVVFFPLYPWLIRIVHLIIPDYYHCAYIVTNVCFVAGCCFFYALVANEYTKKIAFRAVLLLSLFPVSFFFGAVRTESLFFLTSAACLYYIRKHQFPAAGIWGALAALSRMQGLLLVIPAAVEVLVFYKPFTMLKEKRFRDFWKLCYQKVLFIAVMGVGTLIYLGVNYKATGNPFQFLIYQKEHWFQGSTYFTNTLRTMWEQIGSDPVTNRTLWIPQLAIFAFALIILIYGLRRVSVTHSAYFFVYFLMNYSITWPLSTARYMTCALPMFMVLAMGSHKHPLIYKALLVIFTSFTALFLPLFLKNVNFY